MPIGSATLCDNHPPLLLGDRLAARIAALPTSRLRRLAVDFAVERRFRRVDRIEAAALLRAVAARHTDLPRSLHRLRTLGLVR